MALPKAPNKMIRQTSTGTFIKRFSKWTKVPLPKISSSETAHPSRDMFLDVPEEILVMIMQFMRPNQIIAMVQVNKRFHRVGVPEMWRVTKGHTDSDGWTWLHRAARDGDLDMVKRLVAMRYQPDSQAHERVTPVYLAALEGHSEVAQFLLPIRERSGFEYLFDGDILHAAAFLGDKALVQRFLDVGWATRSSIYAATQEQYWHGMHLLHAAAWGGNPQIVQSFLSAGSSADPEAIHGITPLHVAAFRGNKEVFTPLIWYGARVNRMDNSGRSAWSLAMGAGHTEAAELLLKLGAPKCGRYKGIPSVLFARFQRGPQKK